MPKDVRVYRVFIASPSGLKRERQAFRDAIDEYNRDEAFPRSVLFMPVGWEDTVGGVGRPQAKINEDIRECDFFVLLLWDRWGSPTGEGRFSAGIEEEFEVALECYNDAQAPMREIVLLFKALKLKQLADPGSQLTKVIEFRKKIEEEKQHLYHNFDVINSSKELLKRHLGAWLRAYEQNLPLEAVTPTVTLPASEGPARDDGTPFDSTIEELKQAWRLADEGRQTEAETMFARAIVKGADPQAFIQFGRFLHRDGRPDQAMVMFERARELAQLSSNPSAEADATRNVGHFFLIRGDLSQAEEQYRIALGIDQQLNRLEGIASSHGNLGTVLYTRGDLAGAERMYRKALELYEQLDMKVGMSRTYGNLGSVLEALGNLQAAEEMHRRALAIDEQLGNSEGMAAHLGNLGNILYHRGDLLHAEEMHRRALEINQKLGRPEGMANDYGNIGSVLFSRGDLVGAERMHRRALEIDERLGRLEGIASAYASLGNVLSQRGDLLGAEEMHRKSLEINQRLGRLEGIAVQYANLGGLLLQRGEKDAGKEICLKAIQLFDQMEMKHMSDQVRGWFRSPSDESV